MRRFGCVSLWTLCLLWLAATPMGAAEPVAGGAEFQEVYDLARQHLSGVTEAELDRAAVQGLVSALSPKLALVAEPKPGAVGEPLVSKTGVFDEAIAYVRVARVSEGLPKALREACEQLARTNTLKGLVLDLRFAGGDDYAAAAATTDLFLKKGRPLLDWGKGLVNAKDKEDALTWPVAALVNHQTAGPAEALAAVLRASAVGLLLGNLTAGEAMMAQEYPLKNGQRLRVATTPIKLGDGTPLAGGVKPDILVQLSTEEERAYFADPYRSTAPRSLAAGPGASATNATARAARRVRINEADLVRERREGTNPDEEPTAARRAAPEKPALTDPVLARALDLLKGLAVVRQARS